MKKWNKTFYHRQVLTSGEMNNIVDVVNDIIDLLNDSEIDNSYFKMSASTDSIIAGQETNVSVYIDSIDGTDIRYVEIFANIDNSGSYIRLNDPGVTYANVTITGTTTFKAVLSVADSNEPVVKYLTINAVVPTYYGSGVGPASIIKDDGTLTSKARTGKFYEKVSGQLTINTYKGENLYFFVPEGVIFDTEEVYLDSVLFLIKPLEGLRIINGSYYTVYKSCGGEFGDNIDLGFAEDLTITLEIL